jgi:hypothetical protein
MGEELACVDLGGVYNVLMKTRDKVRHGIELHYEERDDFKNRSKDVKSTVIIVCNYIGRPFKTGKHTPLF